MAKELIPTRERNGADSHSPNKQKLDGAAGIEVGIHNLANFDNLVAPGIKPNRG
jgi:hypothetical protein